MSVTYVVYEPADGRILRAGEAPSPEAAALQGDQVLIVEAPARALDATHYVAGEALVPRPEMTVPAAVEAAAGTPVEIAGLPVPSTVEIDGERYGIEDGALTLTLDVPGKYTLRFEAFPHRPAVTEVTVT